MRMRPDRRMERLVLLPFAMGCVSESSVALAHHHHHNHQPTRTRSSSAAAPTATSRSKSCRRRKMDDDEESLSSNDSCESKTSATSSSSTSPPPSKISAGFHRILRTFKSTFVYKEEDEEEEEDEMEIGVPTDVKHVTHIGWNDDVGAAAAAVTSSMIPTTITTPTTTRVNNPMDLEHRDQDRSWDNNNLITHGHHRDQLLVRHHRTSSSALDEIGMGPRRRPLSVISPSAACS